MPEDPAGLLVIDKEVGWTSHDVVSRARGILGLKRVGHAGSLDPDATGVLVLATGRATRLLRFVTALPKHYAGEIVLGVATSTLDASGEVVGKWDMSGTPFEEVSRAASSLTGDILQVPPMVSALKVGGRRLHELAREGANVERAPRRVSVQRFDVSGTPVPGVVRADVLCSSGTYVRSLAASLGERLGGGAHLRGLRRLAIGSFTLEQAVRIEAVRRDDLLPASEAVRDYPRIEVGPKLARSIGHGAVLTTGALGAAGEGPWAVVDTAGALLGVYEAHGAGRAKPAVVLAS
jgi:tRNA pseudouridine55 synthase